MFRQRVLPIFSLVLLGMAMGCGQSGPELAKVTGTVTLNGQPLEGAVVVFSPLGEGRPSAARTDRQGHYLLTYTRDRKGALTGDHKVTVSTYVSADPDADRQEVPEKVPPQYNRDSELIKTVTRGSNTIELELQGEVPANTKAK